MVEERSECAHACAPEKPELQSGAVALGEVGMGGEDTPKRDRGWAPRPSPVPTPRVFVSSPEEKGHREV